MKGNRDIIAGLLLATLVLGGCPRAADVQAQADGLVPSPDQRVYHRGEGFSIVPPHGYRDNGPSFWHIMNFLGPVEGTFTVNVNVWAGADNGYEIEQAGPLLQRVASRHLPKFRLLDEGFRDLPHGKTYYAHGEYRWTGRDVQCLIYCLRGRNGRVYAVTYSAPSESFDTHRPHFEESIATVQTTVP